VATRARGCRELTDVAEALAQAEAEGAGVETVLAAHQTTLEQILEGEFKRMVRRRSMYLLLMVAISLVVGILINLLFVMTGGGSVLTRMG
jgi:putative copper export protein